VVEDLSVRNIGSDRLAVIFGGSGFIGSHLAELLVNKGYRVHIADILPCSDSRYSYSFCDVRTPIALDFTKIPDLVINLAAIHRTPGHAPEEYYETNVTGAIHLSNWCKSSGISKIIFTSSIAVYGPDRQIREEESVLNPITDYGRSKVIAETIFASWQKDDPQSRTLVICRPAVIFGSRENGNFTRLARALKKGYFFYPGGPATVKACGYVKDLVKSLMFVLEENEAKTTIYNFCFPREYTIGQVCEIFHEVSGFSNPHSLPVAKVGKLMIHFPAPVSTLGNRILKLVLDTRVTPKILLAMNFEWEYDLKMAIMDWQKLSIGVDSYE